MAFAAINPNTRQDQGGGSGGHGTSTPDMTTAAAIRFIPPFSGRPMAAEQLLERQKTITTDRQLLAGLITLSCNHNTDQKHTDVCRLLRPMEAVVADFLLLPNLVSVSPPVRVVGHVRFVHQDDIRSLCGEQFEKRIMQRANEPLFGSHLVPQWIDQDGEVMETMLPASYVTDTAVDAYLWLTTIMARHQLLPEPMSLRRVHAFRTHEVRGVVDGSNRLLRTDPMIDVTKYMCILPDCSGSHWSVTFAYFEPDGFKFRMNLMHFDPLVNDPYAPSSAKLITKILTAVGRGLREQCKLFEHTAKLQHRIKAMSYNAYRLPDGMKQRQAGPCGLMVLYMCRCIVAKAPYSVTMVEVMARGPAFAAELLVGQIYPLQFTDRRGRGEHAEVVSMDEKSVRTAQRKRIVELNGRPVYRRHVERETAALEAAVETAPLHAATPASRRLGYWIASATLPLETSCRTRGPLPAPKQAAAFIQTLEPKKSRKPPALRAPQQKEDMAEEAEETTEQADETVGPVDMEAVCTNDIMNTAFDSKDIEMSSSTATSSERDETVATEKLEEPKAAIGTAEPVASAPTTSSPQRSDTPPQSPGPRSRGWTPLDEVSAKNNGQLTRTATALVATFSQAMEAEDPAADQLIFSHGLQDLSTMSLYDAAAWVESTAVALQQAVDKVILENRKRFFDRLEAAEKHVMCEARIAAKDEQIDQLTRHVKLLQKQYDSEVRANKRLTESLQQKITQLQLDAAASKKKTADAACSPHVQTASPVATADASCSPMQSLVTTPVKTNDAASSPHQPLIVFNEEEEKGQDDPIDQVTDDDEFTVINNAAAVAIATNGENAATDVSIQMSDDTGHVFCERDEFSDEAEEPIDEDEGQENQKKTIDAACSPHFRTASPVPMSDASCSPMRSSVPTPVKKVDAASSPHQALTLFNTDGEEEPDDPINPVDDDEDECTVHNNAAAIAIAMNGEDVAIDLSVQMSDNTEHELNGGDDSEDEETVEEPVDEDQDEENQNPQRQGRISRKDGSAASSAESSPKQKKKRVQSPPPRPDSAGSGRSCSPRQTTELPLINIPAFVPSGRTLIPDAEMAWLNPDQLMERLYGDAWYGKKTRKPSSKGTGAYNGLIGGNEAGVRYDSAMKLSLNNPGMDAVFHAMGYRVCIDRMPTISELRTVQRYAKIRGFKIAPARVQRLDNPMTEFLSFRAADRPAGPPRDLNRMKAAHFVWAWNDGMEAAASGQSDDDSEPEDGPSAPIEEEPTSRPEKKKAAVKKRATAASVSKPGQMKGKKERDGAATRSTRRPVPEPGPSLRRRSAANVRSKLPPLPRRPHSTPPRRDPDLGLGEGFYRDERGDVRMKGVHTKVVDRDGYFVNEPAKKKTAKRHFTPLVAGVVAGQL